jgi:hypothetical protein
MYHRSAYLFPSTPLRVYFYFTARVILRMATTESVQSIYKVPEQEDLSVCKGPLVVAHK